MDHVQARGSQDGCIEVPHPPLEADGVVTDWWLSLCPPSLRHQMTAEPTSSILPSLFHLSLPLAMSMALEPINFLKV